MSSSTPTNNNDPALTGPAGLPPSQLTRFGKMLTKTRAFEALVHHAFDIIDDNGDGVVDDAELYAGLLLMHIKLSKKAGPAACYPPKRAVCDRMFRAADPDHSGTLNRDEFHWVMGEMCATILGHMVVFFLVIILLVPIPVSWVLAELKIPEGSYLEKIIGIGATMLVVYLILPTLFDAVDRWYNPSDNSEQGLLPSNREEQRNQRRGTRSEVQNEVI